MAEVNEEIVRVFFETCGFMVRTNVRYQAPGRMRIDSDVDLVVHNVNPQREHPPDNFVLTVEELKGVEYASVEVKGWHTENFNPSLIRAAKDKGLFNFVCEEAIDAVTEALNTARFSKILVVSRLSPGEPYRSRAVRLLKQYGVDHLIEFATILNHIVAHTLPNKDYREWEMLQTVRLLKTYGLLKAGGLQSGQEL